MVLGVISLGGLIFHMIYANYNDDWTCELDPNVTLDRYAPAFQYIVPMNSYTTCMENIDNVFPYFDDNGDGFIDRCEDAQWQHTLGDDKDFAIKFSAPFTRESFRKICGKRFPMLD